MEQLELIELSIFQLLNKNKMKKLTTSLSIILLFTTSLLAQEKIASFSKSTTLIQGGLGLGSYYYIGKMSGIPFQGRFEKAINDEFSLGAIIGRSSSKYTDGFGTIRYNYTIIGARGNYHFDGGSNNKFDPYGGVTLGYNIFSVNTKDYGSFYEAESSAILYGVQVGCNYYFADRIGGWAELGYGASYIGLGITYRISK
jgi:hypothetical protein